MSIADITKRFEALAHEINGGEPRLDTCRDWAARLADICGDLALFVNRLEDRVLDISEPEEQD